MKLSQTCFLILYSVVLWGNGEWGSGKESIDEIE